MTSTRNLSLNGCTGINAGCLSAYLCSEPAVSVAWMVMPWRGHHHNYDLKVRIMTFHRPAQLVTVVFVLVFVSAEHLSLLSLRGGSPHKHRAVFEGERPCMSPCFDEERCSRNSAVVLL